MRASEGRRITRTRLSAQLPLSCFFNTLGHLWDYEVGEYRHKEWAEERGGRLGPPFAILEPIRVILGDIRVRYRLTWLREINTSIPYHSPLLQCCSGSCDNDVIDQRAVNDFVRLLWKPLSAGLAILVAVIPNETSDIWIPSLEYRWLRFCAYLKGRALTHLWQVQYLVPFSGTELACFFWFFSSIRKYSDNVYYRHQDSGY